MTEGAKGNEPLSPGALPPGAAPDSSQDTASRVEHSEGSNGPIVLPLVHDDQEPPTVVSKKNGSGSNGPGTAGISALLQGAKLAHFELISPLGSGGMAAVLLARDTQLDRQVALKILPPENATDPDSVQRFHQEARSAARLDHDHIVRVFFCGEDQGLHFIAFEYVQGETLKTLLDKKGRIDQADALIYLEQLATALIHASQRGVVHRDIKPSNVLITPENKAKLADMGLARSFGPQDKGLTQSGVTLGTFDYISPEQALDPRLADPRSDIYSLGCTFYHVLTGKPPVPDGPPAMKLAHHQQVTPTDPRELVPDLDPRLVKLLSDMMAKDPEQRPPSAEALYQRVREIRTKTTPPTKLWINPKALWSSSRPQNRKDRSFHTALGIMALALVAILVIFYPWSRAQNPEGENGEPGFPSTGGDFSGTGKNESPVPPAGPGRASPEPQRTRVARYQPFIPSYSDFKEWLARQGNFTDLEMVLSGDMDLTPQGDQPDNGLQIQARRVVIRAADTSRPARFLFRYQGRNQEINLAGLTIDAETIEMSDIHFLVDGRQGNAAVDGLKLRPTRQAELRRCSFFQAQSSFDERYRLTSLFLENTGSHEPIVRMQECVFLGFKFWDSQGGNTRVNLKGARKGGQDAITRAGDFDLYLEQCAFGPHERTISLGNASGNQETTLRLGQCTAILGSTGNFLHVEPAAHVAISLNYSLVVGFEPTKPSTPRKPGTTLSTANPTLIQVNGEVGHISFRGSENRYRNIKRYFGEEGPSSGQNLAQLGDFRDFLARNGMGEDESRELDSNPFKNAEALANLQLEISDMNRADTFSQQAGLVAGVFAVQETHPDLRPDDNPTSRLVGVERCGPVDFLANKLPPIEPKRIATANPMELPGGGKARIVDPERDDSSKGLYPTLEQAISASRPGDEILIRHQGPLRCKTVRLDDPSQNLVIRAHPGFRPILLLQNSHEENASLFRLDGAKLHLFELEFAVEPGQTGLKSLSLATLVRPGHLTLNRCSVTLDNGRKGIPMALVTLLDTTGLMRMEEVETLKLWKVELDQTIVRGNGNVVTNPFGRPLEIDARQSLFSMEGSVLAMDPTTPLPKNGESTEGITLKWNKNTSWLDGPFLRLQALGGGLTIPVNATIRDSVVAMKPGTALIRMEGMGGEGPMAKLPDRFHWEDNNNTYANIDNNLMETSNPVTGQKLAGPTNDQWVVMTQSHTPKFISQLHPPMRIAATPLARWTPRDLLSSWKDLIGTAGADLDQLPNPTKTRD